jgi:hypothetical protein
MQGRTCPSLQKTSEMMPRVKNAVLSKFGANKATTKTMTKAGHWKQDCPKLKGNKNKSNGNQYQQLMQA